MPFANPEERADHFHKHGAEFGAKNARDYEAKADAFLLGQRVRRHWIILEVRGIWCASIRRPMNLVC